MSENTLSNYSKQIKRFIGDYFKENPDSKINLSVYFDNRILIKGHYLGDCPLILIAGDVCRMFFDENNPDNFIDVSSSWASFLKNEVKTVEQTSV